MPEPGLADVQLVELEGLALLGVELGLELGDQEQHQVSHALVLEHLLPEHPPPDDQGLHVLLPAVAQVQVPRLLQVRL